MNIPSPLYPTPALATFEERLAAFATFLDVASRVQFALPPELKAQMPALMRMTLDPTATDKVPPDVYSHAIRTYVVALYPEAPTYEADMTELQAYAKKYMAANPSEFPTPPDDMPSPVILAS